MKPTRRRRQASMRSPPHSMCATWRPPPPTCGKPVSARNPRISRSETTAATRKSSNRPPSARLRSRSDPSGPGGGSSSGRTTAPVWWTRPPPPLPAIPQNRRVTPDELLALDRAHVWHPYAGVPGTSEPIAVRSASGVRLRLAAPIGGVDELIDGVSSWWAAIHGYRHPVLDAAAHEQLDRMAHVMFGGLTHEPAVRLAARLASITPEPLRHVFLCDSGSVAVEVAIKMCLQHWRSLGRPEKRRLLTWRGGYHGDTFHAMSVCDPETGMHRLWSGTLPRQVFADRPPAGFGAGVCDAYARHLGDLVEAHAPELAAVIVEPVVQGAGGMRFHDP